MPAGVPAAKRAVRAVFRQLRASRLSYDGGKAVRCNDTPSALAGLISEPCIAS
jgi:hypothetical protein